MYFAFEVLEKDIAGRLGRLKVGEKTVRTPALLPVINPNLTLITPREMKSLGVEALITNAYIFFNSAKFRKQVEQEGIHHFLDFDGVIMTDSGAFQQSIYGKVEISNQETLKFQQQISSDIIVPLDIPTSPGADRETAERELSLTMSRLREARDIAPERSVGPVQGGIFPELRKKAAEDIQRLGFSFCPIGAVVPLMEQYRFRDLVQVVRAAKNGLSPSTVVHLFGAGHPVMFALAVAMGCDLFDSAAYALFARDRRYLTSHGSYRLDEMTDFPCSCEVCRKHSVQEVKTSLDAERLLSSHNLFITLAEIACVRQAIQRGTLWELVDDRCRSHPRLLDGYRALLSHSKDMESMDRVSKDHFFYRGDESCARTEVIRYQGRLSTLALEEEAVISLVGGVSTPYQVFLFKPPFGPFPPELSETFPIGQSVIPSWDEKMVKRGCAGIRALIHSHPQTHFTIISRKDWYDLVVREVPQVEVMCDLG
ncbi:MAG: tRNA guanosine(15) transglycosylase TgtA [Methanomicrobiales archaeon]|nr:tRNA guanosine(15) transglycosylase TgtA [Methanomicrobiales archaeon]